MHRIFWRVGWGGESMFLDKHLFWLHKSDGQKNMASCVSVPFLSYYLHTTLRRELAPKSGKKPTMQTRVCLTSTKPLISFLRSRLSCQPKHHAQCWRLKGLADFRKNPQSRLPQAYVKVYISDSSLSLQNEFCRFLFSMQWCGQVVEFGAQ